MNADLLEQLKGLLPAQFKEVVHRFGVPPEYLPLDKPQVEQAIEVLRYAEQQEGRKARLRGIVDQVTAVSNILAARMPISDSAVSELKQILLDVQIPDDVAEELYLRVAKSLPEAVGTQRLFEQCIDWLAGMRNDADECPFLVFLGACCKRARFDFYLGDLLSRYTQWYEDAIKRARISREKLDTRIDVALAPQTGNVMDLFVKISPDQEDVTQSLYLLDIWAGSHKLEELSRGPFKRDVLGEKIKDALSQLHRPGKWRVELILPLALFDWNPEQVELKGSRTLPSKYPVVVRSWERNYAWWNNGSAEDVDLDTWLDRHLPAHSLMNHHVCCIDESTDLDSLPKRLRCEVWAIIAPCPSEGITGRVRKILLTALYEGMPYMLWPLLQSLDTPEERKKLLNWLCANKHQEWPEWLHQAREKRHPDWKNLVLLWDDPAHRPPDAGYDLLPPD